MKRCLFPGSFDPFTKGHEAVVHLTLTDDHPWAQAFVVIEARPLGDPAPLTLTAAAPARM